MTRNNRNFKHLCRALRLAPAEVVEIMDGAISKSTASAWQRGEDAMQEGIDEHAGRRVRRSKRMSDEQFDTFCQRLIAWTRDEEARR